jgi:hypothetical protein
MRKAHRVTLHQPASIINAMTRDMMYAVGGFKFTGAIGEWMRANGIESHAYLMKGYGAFSADMLSRSPDDTPSYLIIEFDREDHATIFKLKWG